MQKAKNQDFNINHVFKNDLIAVVKIEVDVASVGHITNSYVIYNVISKKALLLDPGYDAEKILKTIEKLELLVEKIVLTHTHYDHIYSLYEVRRKLGVKVLVHRLDVDGIYDSEKNYSKKLNLEIKPIEERYIEKLEDTNVILLDEISLEVIHTPGHTSGGICLFEKNINIMFTGDTIFSNCHGRVDLKSASMFDMKNSLKKVFDRFKEEDVIIFPGHGKEEKLSISSKKILLLMAIKKE